MQHVLTAGPFAAGLLYAVVFCTTGDWRCAGAALAAFGASAVFVWMFGEDEDAETEGV